MDILVTSLPELETALTEEVKSVISICDVGTDPKVDFGDRFVLSLRFDDFEDPNPLNAPTSSDVLSIINSFAILKERGGKVLVHCHGGVCRSTATAFVLKTIELGLGNEKEAAQWVMNTFPQAIPNLLICELADDLLDRKGNLIKAMKAFDAEMNRRVFGDDWEF